MNAMVEFIVKNGHPDEFSVVEFPV